jgi:undecaprenyl diphosphate synthase
MTNSQNITHLAFIMDGNGRWATAKGLPRLAGHKAGVESLNKLVEELVRLEIPYASFYAFSTENWQRSAEEVSGLMALLELYFTKELARLKAHNIRLRFLGDHTEASPLAPKIRQIIINAAAETANNTGTTLLIGLNYGGHDELVRAAHKVAARGAALTVQNFEAALDTAGVPPPDLLIRTSGEQRLSGFLPWQLAYTELYFTPTFWPDFGPAQLQEALEWYATRQRRFGKA